MTYTLLGVCSSSDASASAFEAGASYRRAHGEHRRGDVFVQFAVLMSK